MKCLLLLEIIAVTIFLASEVKAVDKALTVRIDDVSYLLWHDSKLVWKEALKFCKDKNMNLVSFENPEKLLKLTAYLEKQGFIDNPEIGNEYIYWTSGNDLKSEGTFVWESTGNKFSYTNWLSDQPDNWRKDEHCVEMGFRELGKWNDNRCMYHRHFICERQLKGSVVDAV